MVFYEHHIFMILLLITCTYSFGMADGSDPRPVSGPPAPPPPVPSLTQLLSVGDRLVFLCEAPDGHHGLFFELFGNKTLVDTVQHQTEECGAIFTVNRKDVTQEKPFCCLYMDARRMPSAFSTYVYAKLDEEASPLPPPVLESSSSEVQRGQMLSFNCSAPLCLRPKLFQLLRRSAGSAGSAGSPLDLLGPGAVVSSSPDPIFRVGPLDGGLYSCLYQMSLPTDLRIISSASQAVQVTVLHEPNTDEPTDWPFIVGALTAAVLFLAVVVGLSLAVHKKVREVAQEKKRREDAKFWSTVHARDHVVDLPITRLSSFFKDPGPDSGEYADPRTLSTFANLSYS
ncbi:uncharacterized protein LOC116219904 isoform X2 [Clupea harengus]|uniref:Uncharacterized protein LOC116219904 isoform X2 n=1 Tax=Clupea harengus TaxID=7950 RepID=A0A6P8F741_CLUHA|nr:uncharacterized protein LOC116219904 isoform X2 [Clupea harengus]